MSREAAINLTQLHDLANQRSYFSRPDNEIYQALNSASKKIYLWTIREFRNYFIKTDTTTILFTPNVQEYLCPPDLRILIKFGEQLQNSAPGTPFNWLRPADINSDVFILREFESLVVNLFGPSSQFLYAGPYLDAADSKSPGPGQEPARTRKVLISPIPQDTRNTKIYYAAQHVDIVGPQSFIMMPEEAHEAMLDYAVAELVRPNGDVMHSTYEAAGKDKFQNDFLPYMRQVQANQTPLTQEPYIGDLN